MIEQLRQRCQQLLDEGAVSVVIGYGPQPVLITRAEDVDRLVWGDGCVSNLTTYLKRKEVRDLGKAAVIVKGCDERALVVLERESQIERARLHVIGVACNGTGQKKCDGCEVRTPRFANEVIGEASPRPADESKRYGDINEFMQKPREDRLAYWFEELDRCVKCYACRQVCPLCYCERCIVDKNRPTCIDTSATPKGNFGWHITRAFHLAGRCVGCDECTRVCPAGIELRLLNQSLASAAEEHFGYRAGMDREADPIIGSYSLEDKENFIR